MTTRDEALHTQVVHLNEVAFALVAGVLAGAVLLLMTCVLVWRGGPVVGPHLGLLGQFLPGYEVSWTGALVGFTWAFVVCSGLAWLGAALYNRVARWRRSGPR
jgi:hypothetical protein